jgi:hypothetical protein
VAAGWAGTTVAGILLGRGTPAAEGAPPPPRWRRLVIAVAPQVFMVGLLALVATGLHAVLQPLAPAPECGDPLAADAGFALRARWVFQCNADQIFHGTRPAVTLALLGGLAAAALLLSWRVDVNQFSMHLFYRNRLVRAYLGASNRRRRPQPFTGFDPADDLPLTALRPSYTPPAGSLGAAEGWGPYDGPYPLHNATLNLVKGEDLAYQQRKGAAFVLTPLATGYEVYQSHGRPEGERDRRHLDPHGFRPTAGYREAAEGLTLGTAMGISGAAVSPNMGAQTTPAMAFLLTVFNVRLGWWLGNPRHRRTWWRTGPRVGLVTLLSELFGSTDEHSPYVYLSDGGHFDNSSVYELVRRRCRFILATDAGADPELHFADLANVVRKCCTDFGIDIEIQTARILRVGGGSSELHCAIGTVHYERVDPGAAPGLLLYLKASLTGDEPADVTGYHARFPVFPHQPTSDQFFDESQFESYRKLGEHIVGRILGEGQVDPAAAPLLEEALRALWPGAGDATGASRAT